MDNATPFWRTEDTVGILVCGPLRAFAECDPDAARLVLTGWHDHKLRDIEVLGGIGRARLQIAETYVRGNDLVANCASAGADLIAPQLSWRAGLVERGSVARVELVLSVKTELLDSSPVWTTNSFARDSSLYHADGLVRARFAEVVGPQCTFSRNDSDEHLFVFRMPQIGLSYAEMVYPSDFISALAATESGQPSFIQAQLFPERLEKGVIRRARICGWFMPAENDLATAVELARRFVAEPPPLTT